MSSQIVDGRAKQHGWTILPLLLLSLCTVFPSSSRAQTRPAHGAMSAQDIAKLAAPAAPGTTAADQICARSPMGAVVAAPAELASQHGVLELTLNFESVTDAQGLLRYCFVTDTGLEAPTLRVNPGDKLIIHFHNQLPAPSPASTTDNMAGMHMTLSAATPAASSACNGAMGANVTNIHFHGTNVAPVCGQDEVIHTLVQPGQSFDYAVQIPANEPPGLYWYHPHPHGISEGQVQGGATGALIVEGLQTVDPALAGMPERTFVLRDQLLPSSESNDNNIPAWDLSINYVPVTYPTYTPAVIRVNPAQKELWRVANTGADSILNLQYLINGAPQTVDIVAIDGFPIASGISGQQSQAATTILLPPGSRAEFVVTTPNTGDPAQLVTQYWDTGPDGDYNPTRPIANIVSQPGSEAAASATRRLPAAAATTRKLTRFANLASTNPVAQRNLYFSEVLLNPTDPLSPTTFYITQQGQAPAVFTMDQPPDIVVHAGTTEDWVVENRAQEDHIFHIHQLHFQVLEVNGQAVNDPAIRDTVDIPYWSGSGPYPSVKVRMDFRDPSIIGTFVYHCHILEHEDGGMMGEIQVLPAGSTAAVAATASTSSLVPNGNVTLTANVADAATGNPAPTGLVQFEINGVNVGNPVAVANGIAAITTPINGPAGSAALTAFYQGDSTYAGAVSAAIPVTISEFALTSQGTTAAVGSAATASVNVNVATNYTAPIQLSCALPTNLAEAACFANPTSVTGGGSVSLIVNTTPAHPLSASRQPPRQGLFAAGGATTLACLCIFLLPGRVRRLRSLLMFAIAATTLTVIGCGGGAAATKLDPGTTAGTYTVVVTAVSGTGAAQYQASVDVPITVR